MPHCQPAQHLSFGRRLCTDTPRTHHGLAHIIFGGRKPAAAPLGDSRASLAHYGPCPCGILPRGRFQPLRPRFLFLARLRHNWPVPPQCAPYLYRLRRRREPGVPGRVRRMHSHGRGNDAGNDAGGAHCISRAERNNRPVESAVGLASGVPVPRFKLQFQHVGPLPAPILIRVRHLRRPDQLEVPG